MWACNLVIIAGDRIVVVPKYMASHGCSRVKNDTDNEAKRGQGKSNMITVRTDGVRLVSLHHLTANLVN